MLSRSSSDAAIRLRRSKSSSSVQRSSNGIPIEHIDPEFAQQQAHAAALAAYQQAQKPCSSRYLEHAARPRPRRNPNSSEGSHLVARRDSGKRISASAIPVKGKAEARMPSRSRGQPLTGSSTASAGGTNFTQPSRAGSNAQSHQISYAASVASAPPHRTIRKAVSSVDFSDTSADAHRKERLSAYVHSQQSVKYEPQAALDSISEHDAIPEPQGSIKRTFSSFIGQSPRPMSSGQSHPPEPKEQIIRKRTSFMSMPLSRRGRTNTHEPIQTTTTSITMYDNHDRSTPRISIESHLPRYDILQPSKNRAISTSLKDRFTRLFRKTSAPKEPLLLPQQQVTASRSHFSSTWDSPPITYGSPVPHWPKDAAYANDGTRSRTPSGELAHSGAKRTAHVRQASGESQNTATQTGSRVTSWTNSTETHTVTDGHYNKRLSVIDEYGIAQPKHSQEQPLAGVSPSPATASTSSLGRRIYEQLLRRQSETEATASYEQLLHTTEAAAFTADHGRPSTNDEVHASIVPLTVPEPDTKPIQQHRKSSWGLRAAREAAMSTIRAVTPSIAASRKTSGGREDTDFDNEDITVPIDPLPIRSTYSFGEPDSKRPTKDQIAKRVSRSHNRWQAPLEAKAPSYAPISAIDFATATAFPMSGASKRALQSDLPPTGLKQSEEDGMSMLFSPVEQASSRGDCHGAVSPSIYSRNTNESPTKSIPSESPKAEESGSVVVLSSYRIRSGSPEKRRAQHHPAHSAKSSKDWRAWLSEELGEWDKDEEEQGKMALGGDFVRLTEQKRDQDRSYIQIGTTEADIAKARRSISPTPASWSGHHREQAQISDENLTVGEIENMYSRSSSGSQDACRLKASSGSTGNEQTVASLEPHRPQLIERSSSRMNDRFPMIETRRPPSRNSWQRQPSAVYDRRDSMILKPNSEHHKENMYSERETSRASAGQLLAVPENPLLASRPKSMIPLRTHGTTGSGNTALGGLRLVERTPSPKFTPTLKQEEYTEPFLRTHSVTPSIAVTSYSPAKSPSKLSTTPQIKHSSPFTAASSSPRRLRSTQNLQVRTASSSNIQANRTTSYGRPDSVTSLSRKPVPRFSILDDTTIKRIYEGPYASASKENLRSSNSENDNNTSRSLGTKRSFGTSGSNSSPSSGQRMVDEWLKRRATGGVFGAAIGEGLDWKSEATGSPAFI